MAATEPPEGPHPAEPSAHLDEHGRGRAMPRRAVLGGIAGGAAALAAGGWWLEERSATHGPHAARPSGAGGTAHASQVEAARRIAGDEGILVVISLYGGNDGLNTVVPATDPRYYAARGPLAVPASQVLPLADGLGLHPSLPTLKKLWDREQLAVIRGVGYPQPSLSHFRSMKIWHTGVPEYSVRTGWLGRWLDTVPQDPMRAITVGSSLSPALAGARHHGSTLPIQARLGIHRRDLEPAYRVLSSAPGGDTLFDAIASSGGELLKLERASASVFGPGSGPAADDTVFDITLGGTVPFTTAQLTGPHAPAGAKQALVASKGIAGKLDLVARAISLGLATRVYTVSQEGYDSHAAEQSTQPKLLADLDAALAGFFAHLERHRTHHPVVVMIHSEFGRRVHPNGSEGTDHGTAAPVFVLGPGVRGGLYGDEPSLRNLDDGDLRFTTDYRSVYATLVDRLLHGDARQVVTTTQPPVPFLA